MWNRLYIAESIPRKRIIHLAITDSWFEVIPINHFNSVVHLSARLQENPFEDFVRRSTFLISDVDHLLSIFP